MRISILTTLWCVLIVLMTSCGGGGGGSSNSQSITYTGVTDPATIDANNAEALSVGAYQGGQNDVTITLNLSEPDDTLPTFSLHNTTKKLNRLTRNAVARLIPTSHELNYSRALEQKPVEVIAGPCGGDATVSMSTDTTSGEFNGTIIFDNYCDSGNIANGSSSVNGRVDPGSDSLEFLAMGYNPLTITTETFKNTLEGQISFNYTSLEYAETVTMDFLLRDDNSKQVFHINNYFDGINYTPGSSQHTLSGRYYHPDFGYVDISTLETIEHSMNSLWPRSGILRCSGFNQTFSQLTFNSNTNILLEADLDGNGDTEWDRLLNPWEPAGERTINRQPLANAGADQTIYQAQSATLNGSSSTDPEEDLLTYQWTFYSCPNTCPSLENANTVSPTFTPTSDGRYSINLVVNDGEYSSYGDQVEVEVLPLQPVEPGRFGQEWIYGLFGTHIARGGMSLLDLEGDGSLEIITHASPNFWYTLNYDGPGNYVQSYLSNASETNLNQIRAYDLEADGVGEIVIGYQDGRIEIVNGATKAVKETFGIPSAVDAMVIGDITADGVAEIITSDSQRIFVHSRDGDLLWQTTAYGGNSLCLGNVDDDEAIEIIVSSYDKSYVIDGSTHTLQWEYIDGFGSSISAGDVDGDGREEIIGAKSWQKVTIFDAEIKTPKLDLPHDSSIETLIATDLDGDGVAEILFGGLWGTIFCYEGDGATKRWEIESSWNDARSLNVGDVDNDGTLEIIWARNENGNGGNIYVADSETGIEWTNQTIDGPLTAVDVGDIDDDGKDEIIMVTYEGNNGYEDGIIHIFDAATHTLEWQSSDLEGIDAWRGVNSVRIADVDGDGQTEFVLATSDYYDGVIQVYNGQTHLLEQQSANYEDKAFTALAVSDVDGDGNVEIIAGTDDYSMDTYVVVLNGVDLNEEWMSPGLASDYYQPISDLHIDDVDNDGRQEILVTSGASRVYAIDGVTHQYDWLAELPAVSVTTADIGGDGQVEILIGKTDGIIDIYNGATFSFVRAVDSYIDSRINALALEDLDGDSIPEWVVANSQYLSVFDDDGQLLWRSRQLDSRYQHNLGLYNQMPIKDIDGDGKKEIVIGSNFALYQFE